MRKICVVTGSRAEYGLLSGLMSALRESKNFELQIVASAMHLAPEFGLTYCEIERDGFIINEKVEMLVSGESATSISKSIGLGVLGFTDVFDRLKPNLIIVLGDRFETLAAVQTAMIMTIPVAHIHGGEVTEGAIDESIRHAITKMSNLHFVATKEFQQRVIQLGEQPNRVFVSGAPGIDNIKRIKRVSRKEFEKNINFELGELNFLVTYHPVTLSTIDEQQCLNNLFKALDNYPEAKIIITFPNADADGRHIIKRLKRYAKENPLRVYLTESLGFVNYLNAMSYVDCVIGNSSSGLLEVPSFKIPTINIGDRQKGRLKAESVIDCDEMELSISRAIEQALSNSFKKVLNSVVNPYGEGRATENIMAVLNNCDFSKLIRKPFYDISVKVDV